MSFQCENYVRTEVQTRSIPHRVLLSHMLWWDNLRARESVQPHYSTKVRQPQYGTMEAFPRCRAQCAPMCQLQYISSINGKNRRRYKSRWILQDSGRLYARQPSFETSGIRRNTPQRELNTRSRNARVGLFDPQNKTPPNTNGVEDWYRAGGIPSL